jgi:preprotein translocase subunit SecE
VERVVGKDDWKTRPRAGSAGAVAEHEDEESAVSDLAPDAGSERELPQSLPPGGGGTPPRKTAKAAGSGGSGGFKIYKPNQGYHVRVGTVIGAAVLILAGTAFIYEKLSDAMTSGTSYYFPVLYGLSTAFLVGMCVLTYWVVGLNRKANDFFIATEGEMKKVNWSTRAEVIRSTKVVIVTVVLMAILLFVVDVGFMLFFSSIKVLQASPGLSKLFGGGGEPQ